MKRLFVYFAGIGDAVMFVPFLRRLAAEGPLDLLVRDIAEGVFEGQSFVNRLWSLRHPNRGRSAAASFLFGGERRRLGGILSGEGYGEVILLGAERAHMVRWVDGWRGGARVRRAVVPPGHPDRSRVACESLGLAGPVDPWPRLETSEERRSRMAERVAGKGRMVGFQIGSGPVSKWPRRFDVKGLSPGQWAGLATRLLNEGEADTIVFQGSRAERPLVAAVLEKLDPAARERAHDWTGRFPLGDVMALMTCYRALVSVDTGPAHLAAAVGCPLLVFFGPSDPREYLMRGAGPVRMVLGSAPCQFCAGTDAFKRCAFNRCLRDLDDESLWQGWLRLAKELGKE